MSMPHSAAPDNVPERRLTMVEALREALREEMRRDERVILLGEDIGVPGGFGGAFTVTLGLEQEFGHERVLDTPISEAAIAGVAAGAALGGLIPVADVQYGDFLFLAIDFGCCLPQPEKRGRDKRYDSSHVAASPSYNNTNGSPCGIVER